MLSKELWSDKQPTRNYNWDTWIWNPRAWIVRRHFQGNVEVGLFFRSPHVHPTNLLLVCM